MIKSNSKVGIEVNFSTLYNAPMKKLELTSYLKMKVWKKTRIFTLISSIQLSNEILASEIK